MNLNVNEIFYSLQGEGGRQGEASIFIRLTRCNLKCVFCDTDFSKGEDMQVVRILSFIEQFPCRWIVWTGGEPCLQLNDNILYFFKKKGYRQAIESNGHYPLSGLLDYTAVSPKGNPAYAGKINPEVNEIRLPVEDGNPLPDIEILPAAGYYFLSPVFTNDKATTKANIDYCVKQIKRHPRWRLSLQVHKWIGIE
jgi:organic radical activating enzyme